jgi:hypothetical protein
MEISFFEMLGFIHIERANGHQMHQITKYNHLLATTIPDTHPPPVPHNPAIKKNNNEYGISLYCAAKG